MDGVSERVLLAEDDHRIRTVVRMALEDEGYSVAEAPTGDRAVELFAAAPPDVVLLDVMLPGMNGFDVCRALRQASDVPIIMVTARSDTTDVVSGLEAGADDYIVKPFAPKELLARIGAALRRSRAHAPAREMVFGDLELRPEEGVVRRGGVELQLSKTELRLLCELGSNAGKVLSREALLASVWGYDYFGDGRLVDVHVRRLRTKVEVDPSQPRWIVTVRGLGYKLQP
jgi:DNA-binding response OmpR family regulator